MKLSLGLLAAVSVAAALRVNPTPGRRAATVAGLAAAIAPAAAFAEKAIQPATVGKDYGKSEMDYSDFVSTSSGLRYKDSKVGRGATPAAGDRVVIDWSGYSPRAATRTRHLRSPERAGSRLDCELLYLPLLQDFAALIPAARSDWLLRPSV